MTITQTQGTTDAAAALLQGGSGKQSARAADATAGSGAASGSSSTAGSTSSAGDITSTDFLSLLVSELQNQDPTQPTDPNEYVQQLVGVNSLQQLISINQDLGGSSSSTSGSGASGSATTSPIAQS